MATHLAYDGARLRVLYTVLRNGTSPAKEFYDSLHPVDQARLMALFVHLGEQGQIFNKEHFKKVEGSEFFEFKRHQIRILCRFLPKGRLVLVHGFRKKKDRIPPSELEKASRIFSDWIIGEEQR